MSRRSSSGDGCLFVGRLSKSCRVRDLEDVFEPYGRMSRCEIKYGLQFFLIGNSVLQYRHLTHGQCFSLTMCLELSSRSTLKICPPLNLTITLCKYSRYRYANRDLSTDLTQTISSK